MKRIILSLFFGSLIALAPSASVSAASTNNFTITDYRIEYRLGRDDERRSKLVTTETIAAEFPDADQNHGIERAIPASYDGHATNLSIDSVTDQTGRALEYETYSSNGNKVVRIGNPDTYVHGKQTYVLTYTQHDVTRYFADTQKDEFYWDTNGTEWRVPIDNLTIALTIDPGIAAAFTGDVACYRGITGSTDRCQPEVADNKINITAEALSPGENVTVAVGFEPDTFAAYQMSFWERAFNVWLIAQVFIFVIALGIVVWLSVRYYRVSNRTKEHAPIVPEYLPPKDASIQVAGKLLPSTTGFSAQLIDFAVRRYVKIYQIERKSWLSSKPDYEIEIIRTIDDLRPEEQEILADIFAGKTAIGSRLQMKTLKNNTALYSRTKDNDKKLTTLIRETYGLRTRVESQSLWYKNAAKILLLAGLLLLSPALLIVSLAAYIISYTLRPLTDKGLELVRYLKGLKMYIGVAEEERLKMLQGPETARKIGATDPSDPKQLVKLYEKVLPYAVLFGQEKEWNKHLGHYYEVSGQQPDWYSGYAAFNAASFSSAMHSFSRTANYSSASSSSSGGSSGGGSSGGGGGGGGGGGW